MRKTNFLVFISALLILILTQSYAFDIKFYTIIGGEDTVDEIKHPLYHTIIKNGSGVLNFSIMATDTNIKKITIYLPGFIANDTNTITTSPNASRFINPVNKSIVYFNISSTSFSSIVDKTTYQNFQINLTQTINIQDEQQRSMVFEMLYDNNTKMNYTYRVLIDGLSPRVILKNTTSIEEISRNNTATYEMNVNESGLYKTDLFIVYLNSTYPHLEDKGLYYGYVPYYISNKTITDNFKFEYNSTLYFWKDRNTNETYYLTVQLYGEGSFTALSAVALLTDVSSSPPQILGLSAIIYYPENFSVKGIWSKPTGFISANSPKIYDLSVNLSYINMSQNYFIITNKSFNLSYVIENITLHKKNIYDGYYILNFTISDYFRKTIKYNITKVNNTKLQYSPVIEILSPSNNSVILAKPFRVKFKINDFYAQNSTCTLYSNSTLLDEMKYLISGIYSLSSPALGEGYYNITVSCINDFNLLDFEEITIKVVSLPDIMVKYIDHAPTKYKEGDDIVITYNISNYGTLNSNVNTTFKVCPDRSCTSIIAFNSSVVSVSAGSLQIIRFNYTIKSTNKVYVRVEAFDTTSKDYNWNNQNSTLEVYPALITSYNITGGSSNLKPGTNLTLFVYVKHFDNTPVTGLKTQNLTMYDEWHYERKYKTNRGKIYLINDFGNGTYKIVYQTPNMTNNRYFEFGNHNIILKSSLENYASINSTSRSYSINAPFVEIYFQSSPSSMVEGDASTMSLNLNNIGTINVEKVQAVVKTSNSNILSFSGKSTYKCYWVTSNISSSCSIPLKAEDDGSATISVSTSTSDSWFLPINGSGFSYKVYFYSYPSKGITVDAISQQQQDQQSTTQDTNQETNQTEENQESENQQNQETESNEPELEIITEKEDYSILINETLNITIKIKNIGKAKAEKLSISLVYDKENLDITHNFDIVSLEPSEEKVFTIAISSPTKRVGEYTISIEVSYNNKTVEKTIKITLLPTEEKKKEIEDLLNKLKEKIEDISPSENMKVVYQQTKTYLQKAEEKIKNGDYVGAYSLLEKVQKNIEILESSSQESRSSWVWWFIGLLFVIGIVGGIGYYLFTTPKSTYHPEKGYSFNPQVRENRRAEYIKKLKESLLNKINK